MNGSGGKNVNIIFYKYVLYIYCMCILYRVYLLLKKTLQLTLKKFFIALSYTNIQQLDVYKKLCIMSSAHAISRQGDLRVLRIPFWGRLRDFKTCSRLRLQLSLKFIRVRAGAVSMIRLRPQRIGPERLLVCNNCHIQNCTLITFRSLKLATFQYQ